MLKFVRVALGLGRFIPFLADFLIYAIPLCLRGPAGQQTMVKGRGERGKMERKDQEEAKEEREVELCRRVQTLLQPTE